MPIECKIAMNVKNGLLVVVFTAIFCLSIVGNAAVIVTICQRRKTVRSIINFYLLNLAIADLLRTLCCMPSTLVSELVHCWMFGPVMCKLVAYMQRSSVAFLFYFILISYYSSDGMCICVHSGYYRFREILCHLSTVTISEMQHESECPLIFCLYTVFILKITTSPHPKFGKRSRESPKEKNFSLCFLIDLDEANTTRSATLHKHIFLQKSWKIKFLKKRKNEGSKKK